ncbi:hypothetical protein [Streptomyces sp. NPDC047974]|uniref:hypothetical protein n=1 Tax=Streptomyces sp. NPDC047974 TaxID=3154343 RepID=UPI003408D44E
MRRRLAHPSNTTTLLRWLLTPRTSWHARRLVRAGYGNVSFDAAWRLARVRIHPEEISYQRGGHIPHTEA